MKKRDAASAPNVGDRVAYVIIRGTKGSKLYERSEDPIWVLQHEEVYTAGTSFKEDEILNKEISIIKTNRGGKITYHGPGQLICYFAIDLKQREKDIRKLINKIEYTFYFYFLYHSIIN